MNSRRMFGTPARSPRRRLGFSLVEVCLAIGVVTAAVLALVGILGGTFASAREIALQHRAINAITQLDGALQSAGGVLGLTGNTNQSPFDRIYAKIQPASDGKKYIDFFVYEKNQEINNVMTPSVPVVYLPTSNGQFPITEARDDARHRGIDTSGVFRLRVRVSPLLNGKMYRLDPATYEAMNTPWQTGTTLPAGGTGAADNYALAYLPLIVEVFPYDFSDGTDPGTNTDVTQEKIRPILTQTIVLNR